MKAIFNNEIMDWEDISLSPTNRGFKYGDGLFESIAVIDGEPRLFERHLERVRKGAKVLRLHVSKRLDYRNVLTQIKALQAETNIGKYAKVKLYLWRDAQGLYSPNGSNSDFLITIDEHVFSSLSPAHRVGVSEKTVNYPSETSRFKTMNAMKYVVAGIEKEERGLDEIVLLDHLGNVSETLTSNLFFKIGEQYFTPPLSTGCIDGIMRNWMIEELRKKGFDVIEKMMPFKEVRTAQSVFTTNAMGIRHIGTMDQVFFIIDPISKELIETIS